MGDNNVKKTKADKVFHVINILFVALLCLAMGFPLFMTASISLQTMSEIYASSPKLIPEAIQWENYPRAMSNGNWGLYFYNSIIVTLIATGISLIINSMSGYVFARIPFRGRQTLFAIILLGMMVPPEVTLFSVFKLVRSIPFTGGNNLLGQGGRGLMNTYAGLILPYIAGSFGVFLCRPFYLGFPQELDDAARIDGCGRLTQFTRIYLPLSGPVLASLGILKFTGTWNEYTWPLVLTSGDSMKTVQLALTTYRSETEIQWNQLMAATLISGLPIYFLFFFAQKHFVSGLLAGSVKG